MSRFEKGHIPTNPAFLVKSPVSQNPLIDPNWFEMMIRTKNIISLGVCRVLGHQKVKKLSKKVPQLKKKLLLHFFGTPYSFCLTKGTKITSSISRPPRLVTYRHWPFTLFSTPFFMDSMQPLFQILFKEQKVRLPKAQRTCPKLLFCSWASFGKQKSIELWQHNFFKAWTFPSVMIYWDGSVTSEFVTNWPHDQEPSLMSR